MKQPPVADDGITKAAFAREVGLSRQRIGQYCEAGLPQRADGKLNRGEALRWLHANRHSWLGGWAMREKGESRRVDIPLRMPAMRMPSLVKAKDWDELDRDLADMLKVPEFRGVLNRRS